MFQADYPLFIYYFLGGMLATWLVTSAQSRQDVVWSVIPLTVGQILIWFGTTLLAQTPPAEIPVQLTAVAINSLLSLILLFAVSPVLELTFGYSTRFRLMELMSLEQPLMQELMVTIPGTYHHSLVVANHGGGRGQGYRRQQPALQGGGPVSRCGQALLSGIFHRESVRRPQQA